MPALGAPSLRLFPGARVGDLNANSGPDQAMAGSNFAAEYSFCFEFAVNRFRALPSNEG